MPFTTHRLYCSRLPHITPFCLFTLGLIYSNSFIIALFITSTRFLSLFCLLSHLLLFFSAFLFEVTCRFSRCDYWSAIAISKPPECKKYVKYPPPFKYIIPNQSPIVHAFFMINWDNTYYINYFSRFSRCTASHYKPLQARTISNRPTVSTYTHAHTRMRQCLMSIR